jgi:ABC-type multidrug transport system ATPase subunit
VIVSHDLEIAHYCNRVVLLDTGKMIEFGPPEDLINKLLPSNGRAIKLEVEELSEEIIETFKELPEVTFILKTGRNDVKIFGKEIDRKLIKKTIEMCNLMNVEVKSITLDMADFTSYYRIRSKLEKEKLKK